MTNVIQMQTEPQEFNSCWLKESRFTKSDLLSVHIKDNQLWF